MNSMDERRGEFEFRFFEDLLKDRKIYLEGQIDNQLVEKISKLILWLNIQSKEQITLYINSNGGHAQPGFALYDILRFSEAPIAGIVLGTAGSMMIAVLQGCKVRKALRHAVFCFHDLVYRGEITYNNESEIEEKQEMIRLTQKRYNEIIGARIIGGPERIKQLCKTNKTLSSDEAKEIGLIDEVI